MDFVTFMDDSIDKLSHLEKRMGYVFNNKKLLLEALTHRSFIFEQGKNDSKDNEILEFLGDAVLDLVLSASLNREFPDMREGELTKFRAALVNENHLAIMARSIELGNYILLGKGEERSKGREKSSILSCAYEAIAGALFKDGGYEVAADFLNQQFSPWVAKKNIIELVDAKSRLQEMSQEKFNAIPEYCVVHEEGPDHNKEFTVSVRFRGQVLATGTAGSKKEAEQKAAAVAVKNFDSFDFENEFIP
jgi:ribonuclease-3